MSAGSPAAAQAERGYTTQIYCGYAPARTCNRAVRPRELPRRRPPVPTALPGASEGAVFSAPNGRVRRLPPGPPGARSSGLTGTHALSREGRRQRRASPRGSPPSLSTVEPVSRALPGERTGRQQQETGEPAGSRRRRRRARPGRGKMAAAPAPRGGRWAQPLAPAAAREARRSGSASPAPAPAPRHVSRPRPPPAPRASRWA